MRSKTWASLLWCALSCTAACGDDAGSGDATGDVTSPMVTVTSPETSGSTTYLLTGTANDDVGVVALAVSANGTAEQSIAVANPFSLALTLQEGGNDLRVTALDAAGNQGVTNLTVVVTIEVANTPPTANPQTRTLDEDVPAEITLTGSDPDDDTLTFEVTTPPEHGALDTSALPIVVYTPDENYAGPDSFTFAVSDGLESDAADVTLDVSAVNDAPTAIGPAIDPATAEDTPVVIALDGEDLESEVTLEIATEPAHGSLDTTDIAQGDVTYTPDAGYFGPDSFGFVANDGELDSAEVTVDVTVTSVPDAPVAAAATYETREDTPLSFTLQATDVDTAPGELVFSIVAAPDHGSLDPIGLPGLVYLPDADYSGPDSLTFQVADGPRTHTATVTLTIAEGTRFYVAVDGVNTAGGLYPDAAKATLGGAGGALEMVDADGNDEIHLASGRYCEAGLVISQSVQIVGTGADTVFLDGSQSAGPCVDPGEVACEDRGEAWPDAGVLRVDGGEALAAVELVDLTIENGLSPLGGGVYNEGMLTLDGVVVQDNCAANGGGIATFGVAGEGLEDFGRLTLRDSIVRRNESTGDGGGIYTGAAFVAVIDSEVSSNRAAAAEVRGGGIFFARRVLLLERAVLEGNSAISTGFASGGGLYVYEARLDLLDTVIRGNGAGGLGTTRRHEGGGFAALRSEVRSCPPDSEGIPRPDCFVDILQNRAIIGAGGSLMDGTGSVLSRIRVEENEATSLCGGLEFEEMAGVLVDSVIRGNRAVASTEPCSEADPFCDARWANPQGGGGVCVVQAQVTMLRVDVSENAASDYGGGVYLMQGDSLLAEDSSFVGNLAGIPGDGDGYGGAGGGVYLGDPGDSVTLDGCELIDNRAQERGGALATNPSYVQAVAIEDTEIVGNTARAGVEDGEYQQVGGGLALGNATVTIHNSRIGDNESADLGGGLTFGAGSLTVTDSLIDGNRAIEGDDPAEGVGPDGAAFYLGGGTAHFINTTFSGNATEAGGATLVNASAGENPILLSYVTLADNESPDGATLAGRFTLRATAISGNSPEACAGDALVTANHSAEDDDSCGLDVAESNLSGADLALGELADNGGPWPTHLPAATSPAIDLAPTAVVEGSNVCLALDDSALTADARGEPRPVNGNAAPTVGCDAGAVEVQP